MQQLQLLPLDLQELFMPVGMCDIELMCCYSPYLKMPFCDAALQSMNRAAFLMHFFVITDGICDPARRRHTAASSAVEIRDICIRIHQS